MGKGVIIAVAVILIILVVVLASIFGIVDLGFQLIPTEEQSETLDDNISGTVAGSTFSDLEIHQAICFLTNKTIPYNLHSAFIDGLHMKMWGIDGTTAYAIFQDYKQINMADGFISYDDGIKRGPGWTAYAEIWYNNLAMGRAITVGDGSAVRSTYGYDVVLITSNGAITDYYDYVVFLNSY